MADEYASASGNGKKPVGMDKPALIKNLTERLEALRGVRSPWTTLWSEISDYVMPRRAYNLGGSISPSLGKETRLFDTTAVQSNMTLANGMIAWMSPMEAAWFSFEPEPQRSSDAAKRYLAECSEITRQVLATTNTYTAIHEFYLDRSAFGTACLYAEPGRKNKLNVQCWSVGTFVIDTDDEGNVDTVMREFTLTPRQAKQKFGEENLSGRMRDALKAGGSRALDPCKCIHAIYPREDTERDMGKADAENMPIACVYFEIESGHCFEVGGYEEMPVFVSRYLEWGSGMGHVYGWSPSFAALPEARQVNFGAKMLDAGAEKEAFPPMLSPDELEGEIDPNANGVTYFSAELASRLPRRLQDGPVRLDWMVDRVKERQEAIKTAFHVDLFAMFAQIEKQMTAREVAERSAEKLIQFSPTFARLTTELFNPFLQRVFAIGLRDGWLGVPPEEMLRAVDETRAFVEPPQIQYASRIALALKSLPTLAYQRTLERIMALAPISPSILDVYNLDEAERQCAMNDGLPPDFIKTEEETAAIRAQRQSEVQQSQQMEQAGMAADAAAKLGKVPADTPVGQAMGQLLPPQQQKAA